LSDIRVTAINIPTSASMLAQVSARPNRVAGDATPQVAGQNKNALEVKQIDKPDMLANLKAIEAQIAARATAQTQPNPADLPDSKKQAQLAIQVQAQQNEDQQRALQLKNYKEAAYSAHGFKGAYIDSAA
jgi:hypothetical protein